MLRSRWLKTVHIYMVAAFLSLSLAGCGSDHAKERKRAEISNVVVSEVSLEQVPQWYETTGSISAETVSTVSSRVVGQIRSIKVQAGDRVKPGQLLVTIDDRDLVQRVLTAREALNEAGQALESAKDRVDLAEKTFARFEGLIEKRAVSQQEFDRVKAERDIAGNELARAGAGLKRAEAGLKEAELYKSYANVVSPVEGLVIKKHTSKGSLASPGAPLLTIEADDAFKLVVNVDARYQGAVKVGSPIEVSIDSLNETCGATVTKVVPAIDPATRTFVVEANSEGQRPEGVRSGLFAKARFVVGSREAVVVPADALVKRGQLVGVYVVGPEGLVTYRLVRTKAEYKGRVEVISGLKPGDRVIVEGVQNAVDGGILKEQ